MKKTDPKAAKVADPLTQRQPRWKYESDEIDYLEAFRYLTLFMDIELAFMVSNQLRDVDSDKIYHVSARDLLHAAELPVLDRANAHITHELTAIATGLKLSPILCLRGDRKRRPLIANGYYRICAAYHCDLDIEVPIKIV